MKHLELGYYTVDNTIYLSKIDACIYSTQTKKPIQWHFNDQVFSEHNWTVEPTETLDQLYDRRAREIRQEYDYIILSYSGGSDSNNVLEAFMRQGLHIDEIVMTHTTELDGNYLPMNISVAQNMYASEFKWHGVPRLQELKNRLTSTKFTVVDLSKNMFDFFLESGDEGWVHGIREKLSPSNLIRWNFTKILDIRRNYDAGKRIAIILGVEKPRTVLKDGKFFTVFNDRACNITNIDSHHGDYSNVSIEYFYWSPRALDIMTKQAHVLKRWAERTPQNRALWRDALNPIKQRLVFEKMLKTMLYTTWDPKWYQGEKSISDWYNEVDDVFINGQRGTKAHDIWLAGLRYVEKNTVDYHREINYVVQGLKPFTKWYYIGDERV